MIVYVAEAGDMYEAAHSIAVFSTEPLAWSWLKGQRSQWKSVVPVKVDTPQWEEP